MELLVVTTISALPRFSFNFTRVYHRLTFKAVPARLYDIVSVSAYALRKTSREPTPYTLAGRTTIFSRRYFNLRPINDGYTQTYVSREPTTRVAVVLFSISRS